MRFVTIFVRNKNVFLRSFQFFSLQSRLKLLCQFGCTLYLYTVWRIVCTVCVTPLEMGRRYQCQYFTLKYRRRRHIADMLY